MSAFLHYPQLYPPLDRDDEGIGSSVARLILDSDFGQYINFNMNGYLDLSRNPSTNNGGTLSTVGSFQSIYRLKYLAGDFWREGLVSGQLGFDRLNIAYTNDPLNITVGRFPVNYSVMNIFTPNDFFSPFSTTAINKVYKPGVDALRIGISPDMLSLIELLGVWGYTDNGQPAWNQSAIVLRASTVLGEIDWALLGGKLAARWFGGASLQGDIETIGLCAEGHVGFPDYDADFYIEDINASGSYTDDIYVRLSAGLNKMFEWQNSSIGAEYMYLSDGASGAYRYMNRSSRLYPDDQTFLGQHYVGATLSGEIIPILRVNTIGIINAVDYSGVAVMLLVYNIADEAELIGGILAAWGDKPLIVNEVNSPVPIIQSEFGMMPLTVFIETRSYF